MKTVVWLREDLRLLDNPALSYAAQRGEILPVFICPTHLGGARNWWLHHSLSNLMHDFAKQGVELLLKTGEPTKVLTGLCEQIGAEQVVWNRVYSPLGMGDGAAVKQALSDKQLKSKSFNAEMLIEPSRVLNKQGTAFKVFTPFWRHCLSILDPSPVLVRPHLNGFKHKLKSESLDNWGLLPSRPDWAGGLADRWQPGELSLIHI